MRMRLGGVLAAAILAASLAGRIAGGQESVSERPGEYVAPPAGALTCGLPSFDFGETYPDRVIAHTFVLKNSGTNVIRIQSVHTGCGCTTTALTTNVLAVGQDTDLVASLDLKGRRGLQQKSIYVESDDPKCPRLRLDLIGTVVVPVEVLPEGVHFGTLARDGNVEREVQLLARSNVTFQVKDVSSSSSQFTARVETQEKGKAYRIKIQSLGPRPLGTSQAAVQVETDCPVMPSVSIPVAVFVAGDIVSAPATLMLVQGATNVARTYYVGLYSPAGKAFKITKVEPPDEAMKCKAVSVAADRQRLEISVNGPLAGLDGKTLRIETDLATMSEVIVPLRVIQGAPPGGATP